MTFEQNYKIKINQIEPNEILKYISKILKILFINKSNNVLLTVDSNIDSVILDIHMFKYLVC